MIDNEDLIENRLQSTSQNWKVKVENYQYIIDVMKNNYSTTYFDTNPDMLKKLINESNAFALEKALELIVFYLKASDIGQKNLKSELQIFVEKCFKSSRQQTKNWGIEIFVIQCEKGLVEVVECLTTFLVDSRPMIVNGVIETLLLIIKKYKITLIKKLISSFPKLFESRDQQTRTLIKSLTVEIGHIYGKGVIDSLLKELKPIHVNDINADLNKVVPVDNVVITFTCENDNTMVEDEPEMAIPFFDILILLKSEFFDKLDGTKQERKEALEFLCDKITSKRLSNGNYRELVKKLCYIVSKDSQISSVMLAIRILAEMAKSLGKNFTGMSLSVIEACLEKFKEKKAVVIALVRQCIDASFATTTLDPCLATITEALDNKNPTVRSETVAFLLRQCVIGRSLDYLKKQLKQLMPALRRLCEDSVVEVRDQTFQLIGQLWSANNARMIEGFLEGIDSVKMLRIKSFVTKDSSTIKPMPEEIVPVEKKIPKIVPKIPATKKPCDEAPKKNVQQPLKQHKEIFLSLSEFEDKCSEIFGSDRLKNMNSAVWQNRVTALDGVAAHLAKNALDPMGCQVVARLILAKPGLKDSNFAVVKKKCEILQTVFRDHKASGMVAELCVPDVVEKLGDIKVGSHFKLVLPMLFKMIVDLNAVTLKALQATIDSKSIRCNTELLKWLADYLGNQEHRPLCTRDLIPAIKQLLSSVNADVKRDTITLIGVLYKISGRAVVDAFDREKPTVFEMIEKEVAKIDLIRKEEKKKEASKPRNLLKCKVPTPEPTPEIFVPDNCETDIQDNVSESLSVDGSGVESGTVFKDDARFLVFDLCEKLNAYIEQYTAPAFESELKEIFSSIMVMGDKRKQSVVLLKSALMASPDTKLNISTQTESEVDVPVPFTIKTPNHNFITRRRPKKTQAYTDDYVNEVDDKENLLRAQSPEKQTLFGERGNIKKVDEEKSTIDTIVNTLQNTSNTTDISDALSKLPGLLKFDTDLCPIMPALIVRLTIIENDSENNNMPELAKITSLLYTIYCRGISVSTVSDDNTQRLLSCQFNLMNKYRTKNCPIAKDLFKTMNTLTMKIIEVNGVSKVLYLSINLLDQCFENSDYKGDVSTMISKVIWEQIKLIKSKIHLSDDYLTLTMNAINTLFRRYLDDEDIVNSITFKLVKTLINKLTKLMRLDLLRFLPADDNHKLTKYIHHCHERT